MKRYLTSILFFSSVCIVIAQSKVSFGGEVGIPQEAGTDGISTGFGGSLRFEGRINKNFNWLISAGYIYFPLNLGSGVSVTGSSYSLTGHESLIPVATGIKYYLNQGFQGFYFGTELGLTLSQASAAVSGVTSQGGFSSNNAKFAFSPGMGYHFKRLDFTFRYNVLSYSNYFGARAAVV